MQYLRSPARAALLVTTLLLAAITAAVIIGHANQPGRNSEPAPAVSPTANS